jgi:hypothetical protein
LQRFALVGYVLTGTRTDKDGTDTDAWVARTDGVGKLVWEATLGGDKPDSGWSLAAHPNEAVVVAGETESSANGPSDGLIARLQPGGTVQWQKLVGSVGSDGLRAVVALPGGGSVAVGRLGSVQGNKTAMVAMRHDDAGTFGWQTTVPALGQDMAQAVALAQDGGVWLAGRSGDPAAFATRVVRLSASGNVLWDRTLPTGANLTHARGIAPTDDGGAGLTGASNADATQPDGDASIVRLDALGNVMRAKTYPKSGKDVLRGVLTMTDQGFLAVGATGPANDRDGRVIRTDAWGHASCVPNCAAKEPPACQDSNPCTADQCGAGKGCFFVPLPNGAACGGGKTCQAAVCK